MGTAGRAGPLRRTGSLLGLLGLELAAVVGLHWLGRFEGLRIRWDEPVPWLLASPVQEVLGALLRTVGLVMAYWLLASTLLYLLASLTRLPSAVRAVRWATLPLARRVADHAVAVTLATSMVGSGTLGMASPALAADSRGSLGPPANKPAAAAQAGGAQDQTTTTAGEATEPSDPSYVPDPAGQTQDTGAEAPAPEPKPKPKPREASEPAYAPKEAEGAPRLREAQSGSTTTTTTSTTTTTTAPTTTTSTTTTTTAPSTTTTTTAAPTTTTAAPTTTTAATTTTGAAAPEARSRETTTTPPAEKNLKPPGYTFHEAGPEESPGGGGGAAPKPPSPDQSEGAPGGGGPDADRRQGEDQGQQGEERSRQGEDRGRQGEDEGQEEREADGWGKHPVEPGDNLWTIARAKLEEEGKGASDEPTNRQIAAYWRKVIAANVKHLDSRDPDLIYPDETIRLPPVDE